MVYLQLALSIILEVIGTSLMKKTNGFTNVPFTVAMLGCYAGAFYFLSHVVKILPIGIVYATWSGLGIILVSVAAYFLYQQTLDKHALIGIAFIIVGVIFLNVFSKSPVH